MFRAGQGSAWSLQEEEAAGSEEKEGEEGKGRRRGAYAGAGFRAVFIERASEVVSTPVRSRPQLRTQG